MTFMEKHNVTHGVTALPLLSSLCASVPLCETKKTA